MAAQKTTAFVQCTTCGMLMHAFEGDIFIADGAAIFKQPCTNCRCNVHYDEENMILVQCQKKVWFTREEVAEAALRGLLSLWHARYPE